METDPSSSRLAIKSPLATPGAKNYRMETWPPLPTWPVVMDAAGTVVSRYGDPVWRLDPWAGRALTLSFGDGPGSRAAKIDSANANILRQLAAWWIWGPRAQKNPVTVVQRVNVIRRLFFVCSENGIVATNLSRFPRLIEEIALSSNPSTADTILTLLNELYQHKENIGFVLLDKTGLIRLESSLPSHESKQTPYIPPRIWSYQVKRLRECLDDFLVNQEKVVACYRFCLAAYAVNYGSLSEALNGKTDSNKGPFSKPVERGDSRTKYHGPFELTARAFGIYELLQRWVGTDDADIARMGIHVLTNYMFLVSRAGLAYILNFSLMRVAEVNELRVNCLTVENDPNFGELYVLCGVTTKTVEDDDARWPTSPNVRVAVDAICTITNMQLECVRLVKDAKIKPEDLRNPRLIQRSIEPWTRQPVHRLHLQLSTQSYAGQLTERFPKLFSPDGLRITKEDLELARFINPTLDAGRFSVGKQWPLAYHQLRRTGAVNMQASGLVSDASVQYLLKHATRAMTLYYGRGYSRLRLNDHARALYVRTMYEVLGKELSRLLSDRFVSPHGEKRKTEVVRLVAQSDLKRLIALGKKGEVATREILLGYCMNRDPCPYGGIDSIAHCGGGDSSHPCSHVLYDKNKLDKVRTLERILDERLRTAKPGSPLSESLMAQKRAVENFKSAI